MKPEFRMASRRVLAISALILGAAVIGGAIWYALRTAYSQQVLMPEASARNQVDELLSYIQQRGSDTMPTDLPGYLRVGDQCWLALKRNLEVNAKTPDVRVASETGGENGWFSENDRIEVWLDVSFPDGALVQVLYSQGGLAGCR